MEFTENTDINPHSMDTWFFITKPEIHVEKQETDGASQNEIVHTCSAQNSTPKASKTSRKIR